MTNHTESRHATINTPETTPKATVGPSSVRLLLEASHGGAFSVIEMRVGAGFSGPPMPHHHTREEASFIVLEGALAIAIGNDEHVVGAGSLAHVPRGVDFVWRNASAESPARFLCVYAPAGFEQMFPAIAHAFGERAAPPTPAVMRELMPPIWQRFGIETPSR